jgi:hypothetical protein
MEIGAFSSGHSDRLFATAAYLCEMTLVVWIEDALNADRK